MFVTKDFLKALESLAKVHYLNLIHIHFISVIYRIVKNNIKEKVSLQVFVSKSFISLLESICHNNSDSIVVDVQSIKRIM